VAVPTVALATLAWYTVGEPQRGITEAALQGEYENNDFEYEEKIDWEKTKMLMKIRTNLCVILQASALSVSCSRLHSLLSPHKGSCFSVSHDSPQTVCSIRRHACDLQNALTGEVVLQHVDRAKPHSCHLHPVAIQPSYLDIHLNGLRPGSVCRERASESQSRAHHIMSAGAAGMPARACYLGFRV